MRNADTHAMTSKYTTINTTHFGPASLLNVDIVAMQGK